MAANWADFATKVPPQIPQQINSYTCTHQAVTFDRVVNASGAVPDDHADFVERLTHLTSLLHALALQHLRGDWHLSNLVAHDPTLGPPPVVRVSLLLHLSTAFAGRGGVARAGAHVTAELSHAAGVATKHRAVQQARCCWRTVLLARGVVALHPYVHHCVLCCMATDHHAFSLTPLGVIGEIIEEERTGLGSRLEKLQAVTTDTLMTGNEWVGMTTRDRFMQLSTGIYVPGAAERVQVVYAWLHDLINWRLRTGGMWLPAPITTQLFNGLSAGFRSFEDARWVLTTRVNTRSSWHHTHTSCHRKLVDTPFPFPWSQSLMLQLLLFAIVMPFIFASFVNSWPMSLIFTFITVLVYFSMLEVARCACWCV